MRIGINNPFVANHPFDEWSRFNRAADETGAHQMVRGDTQAHGSEMVASLAMVALETRNLRLGTTVTNPVTRHPAVVAAAFATLQQASGGRMWMGISVGNSAVRALGLPPARLADLEEFVATFRALLDRGEARYRGDHCVLPWGPELAPAGVPVYIGANGPRSLRLAGRIADGVIVGGGVSPELVDASLAHVAAGAAEGGRTLADVDVWFQAVTALADTDAEAVEMAKDVLAGITSRNFRTTLEGKGAPADMEPQIRAFEADYRYAEHVSGAGNNAALLDRHGLTDLATRLWLVGGTPDSVVARLHELARLGVSGVQLVNTAVGPRGSSADPWRYLERLRSDVLPQLVAADG